MIRIILLRHAKVNIINEDFYKSRISSEGKKEVDNLLDSGFFNDIKKIYSSPFYRAQDTAEIIGTRLNLDVEITEDMAEWKLQTLNHPNYFEEEKKGWENPSDKGISGESLLEVQNRGLFFLKNLNKICSEENVLILTHGTIVELICAYIKNRTINLINIRKSKHLDYAILELNNDKLSVIKDILSD